MKRSIPRFLLLFILLTSVYSMPVRDTGDRESEEDGILIDQALLRIFEAEDELVTVAEEIEQLYEHREHTLKKDTDLDVPEDIEEQPMGDQPLEDQLQRDYPHEHQLQGDQPMEDLPQGDMPMEGPIDDNEAQEIRASPTPPILGGSNNSIPPERQLQEFANGEVSKINLRKENIRDIVWSFMRPGNNSAFAPKGQKKRVDAEHFQRVLRLFNNSQRSELFGSPNDVNRDGFTKMQSLYPSCEIPKNTDEEIWLPGENSFSMNLLFDFNQTQLAGNGLDVREATLRLYKIAQTQDLGPWVTSCSLQNSSQRGGSDPNPTTEFSTTSENTQTTEEQRTTRNPADQLVRVSVYLYTRALKKNRVKRKLLESRTISLNNDEYTAWNVLTAAKVYLQTRKNFGLLVEVEDENDCLLPARRIFKGMNCSGEAATARPLPYPIMKVHNTLNQDTFPIMDIRSYEIRSTIHGPPADMDILSTAAAQTSDSEISDHTLITRPTRRSSSHTPLDAHRHRHGDNTGNHRRRRKQQNSTEEEDIPDFRSLIIPQRIIMTAAEQHRRLSKTTPQPVTR